MDIYQPFTDIYLCTLAQLKAYAHGGVGTPTYSDDVDETYVFYIRWASESVVFEVLRALPLPFEATMYFDAPYSWRDGKPSHHTSEDYSQLRLDQAAPCLAVTTLTNGDGDTISSDDYELYRLNVYPKRVLRLTANDVRFEASGGVWEKAISVVGTWGYVPHYTNAWRDSGKDVPTGDISDSATSFTFSTAGDAAQYSAGDYIRIDNEVLCVTDSDSTTGVVTVERGALGTTAAAHTAATDIEQYQHHRQIASVTAALAYGLYRMDRQTFPTDEPTTTIDTLMQRARRQLINHINWIAGNELY